jgi:hypothetical protein
VQVGNLHMEHGLALMHRRLPTCGYV